MGNPLLQDTMLLHAQQGRSFVATGVHSALTRHANMTPCVGDGATVPVAA